MFNRLCQTLLCLFVLCHLQAQDSSRRQDSLPPLSYAVQVGAKAQKLQSKLERQSAKALKQFQKKEAKIKAKLSGIDSLKAREIFGDAQQSYDELQRRLANVSAKQYIPSLDTLSASLRFLEQNSSVIKGQEDKIKQALSKVNGLETQFQKAEEIKKFLKERKQYLKERLGQLGFAKQLKRLNKQAYYYGEQLNESLVFKQEHRLIILYNNKSVIHLQHKRSSGKTYRMPRDNLMS
jgi:hypothetical protein